MKEAEEGTNWFFVDEAGDPTFYDRKGNFIVGQPGCSPLLILGFIELRDPMPARQAILELQKRVTRDPLLSDVPSVKGRTAIAFHAKDDIPEVRYQFYNLIAGLDFKTQFIVARKIERVFRGSFSANENQFYDHLIECLFQNVLHRFTDNQIYFAKRGSRSRQVPLELAIQRSIKRFETKHKITVKSQFKVQPQTPSGEPCLSIIDYMNWAVMRAYTKQEMRYYRFVESKVDLLVDLYDRTKYPNNWYSHRDPFDIQKASPL